MKNKFYTYSILFATFVLSSCEKNLQEQFSAVKDLKVPSGFSWETSRNVNFTVEVSDTRFNDAIHVISIYKGDPSFGGTLLSTGSASVASPFESKIYLADTVSKVFILKTAPDNSSTMEEVNVQSAPVKLSIGQISTTIQSGSKVANVKKLAAVTTQSSPDCNTGCSEFVNLTSNNMDIEIRDGRTICVNGSNKTFDVTFKNGGGTLRICGTNLTIQNIKDNSANSGINIVLTKGSSAKFSALNFNNSQDRLENFGSLTFDNLAIKGMATNYGTISIRGDYNLNTGNNPETSHTNYGTITVGNNLNVGSQTTLSNLGKIVVGSEFKVNGQGTFINKCSLKASSMHINHVVENHGFIDIGFTTKIQGNVAFNMYNGALLKTGNLELNNTLKGFGSTSIVKVASITDIQGGGLVTGEIQFCDDNGIEKNNGRFTGNATLGCNLYIPATECNEGNGKTPDDADDDGITDALDAYPNDSKRAFNNYYPSADTTQRSTLVFEDNWPRRGDYDMNDLAISYRYKIVTNSSNEVVDIVGDYSLYASGGDFENGFGVEFPVTRSSVTHIAGGSLEEGQTKAVAVLFQNMRQEMAEWNTVIGKPVSAAKNYKVTITLVNGPLLKTFGLSAYNPFIFKNKGRGTEVHLPGMPPTNLANTSLFGTNDDNSSVLEGKYYVTTNSLPWALNIPVNAFEYPTEKTEIADAYLKFGAWVQSGGTSFIDWYINKEAGYRSESKIYRK